MYSWMKILTYSDWIKHVTFLLNDPFLYQMLSWQGNSLWKSDHVYEISRNKCLDGMFWQEMGEKRIAEEEEGEREKRGRGRRRERERNVDTWEDHGCENFRIKTCPSLKWLEERKKDILNGIGETSTLSKDSVSHNL